MDNFEQIKKDCQSLEELVSGFCGEDGKKAFRNYAEECAVRIWSKDSRYSDNYPTTLEAITGKTYTADQMKTALDSFRGNVQAPVVPEFFKTMTSHDSAVTSFITGLNSLLVAIANVNGDFTLDEANEVQRIMNTFYSLARSGSYHGVLNTVLGAIDELLGSVPPDLMPTTPFNDTLQDPVTDATNPTEELDTAGAKAGEQEAKAQTQEQEAPRNEEELKKLLDEMDSLIGMDNIKSDVRSLMNFIKISKLREERGMENSKMSYHLVFTGNPGTGKTTIARLIASLYYQIGVLPKGQLVEVDRSLLVAGYVGQTAIKTRKVIDQAMGGVLFIDEAYSLANDDRDSYGSEAIETILKAMEDHRDELVVIVAGYTELMHKFIESNPGLSSRFNKYFEFKDYNGDELLGIFKRFCKQNGYTVDADTETMLKTTFDKMYEERDENFGNARTVRNIFEKSIANQADRLAALENVSDEQLQLITMEDLQKVDIMQKAMV